MPSLTDLPQGDIVPNQLAETGCRGARFHELARVVSEDVRVFALDLLGRGIVELIEDGYAARLVVLDAPVDVFEVAHALRLSS